MSKLIKGMLAYFPGNFDAERQIAQLLAKRGSPLLLSEIAHETGLPPLLVRGCLWRLRRYGAVEKRKSLEGDRYIPIYRFLR